MAEYVTVIKELHRMCGKNNCAGCPITKTRHKSVHCRVWMDEHPEETERIIMEWAAEHSIKTNKDKFMEVFGMDIEIPYGDDSWLYEEYKENKHET